MRIDLRIYKKQLRSEMRAIRAAMSPALRGEKDRLIFHRLIRLPQYHQAHTIITYVSTAQEVDTRRLMERAWADGKKVVVPRCVPGTHRMEMFYIHSMDELEPGSYGILEPNASAESCKNWKGSLCVVPAFCNDRKGYRLGYGGGYYDRFLSQYKGTTVGINYSECVREQIHHGRYDVPLQMLLTEREKIRF
ncbi:MAG: 5-formyltetrahydrofolate cyclo-ligase [Negativibacillus sp.]